MSDDPFTRTMGLLLGPPLAEGNDARALVNGDEIFPAMLSAIGSAQRTITFETYVYWSGDIGRRFGEALAERAAAGVQVLVMLDWFGSGALNERAIERMRQAGVQVRRYNPPRWTTLGRLNNRTHRKLLVVDGRVGFTGGVGIADKWRGDAQDSAHWRDTHFRVEGPAVAQIQAAFLDNWLQVTGELHHGPGYFPVIEPAGGQRAHLFTSSAGGGAESAQLMYLVSIASARESIALSMAYFVPDDVAVESLVAARRRGVQVRLIVPGPHIDFGVVRRASRTTWGPLLAAGVEIHEYQPTMFHCKVLVVDALWTSVGSTNFDSRSFSVNDEANLNVYDAGFARAQLDLFERDLAQARRITLQAWQARPWTDKLLDWAAGLLSSQL